jgi:hypothetical protein
MAQMSLGAMPHDKVLHSMELLGTKVAPEIRKHIVGQKSQMGHISQ